MAARSEAEMLITENKILEERNDKLKYYDSREEKPVGLGDIETQKTPAEARQEIADNEARIAENTARLNKLLGENGLDLDQAGKDEFVNLVIENRKLGLENSDIEVQAARIAAQNRILSDAGDALDQIERNRQRADDLEKSLLEGDPEKARELARIDDENRSL